jgi:carbonic anhydrase
VTFEYDVAAGLAEDTGHAIAVKVLNGGTLRFNGERYDLVQFHFHTPSEHTIGGRPADAVAHLVHRNRAGKLAVVAVLFEQGDENPFLKELVRVFPVALKNHTVAEFSLSDLLPADHEFYAYTGSLTTPPCTEGVQWLVLRQTVPFSELQQRQLEGYYTGNARPVQPVHGRVPTVSGK